MKEIRLKSIIAPDPGSPYYNHRLYKVHLGNGQKAEFVSLAQAKRYLARCNRFLNLQLHQINDLYGQVFLIYRQNWFYLDKDPGTDHRALGIMDEINGWMKLLIDRSGWPNGNTFTFTYLENICLALEDLCSTFAGVQYSKSNMPEYWRIMGIKNQIFRIRMDIASCGQEKSV